MCNFWWTQDHVMHDSICEQTSLYFSPRPYGRIFQSMCGASTFLRHLKKFQSGGLGRSRPPLCIGPRGAMINHASRNFSKHARGVSIFEASKKFQSGGLVRSRPALCIGLRGAMAHHASRNFAKHAWGASIFEASKKFPSGGLVRSRHQLDEGLRGAMVQHTFRNLSHVERQIKIFAVSETVRFATVQDHYCHNIRTRRSLRGFSFFWSQVCISHLIFWIHTPQLFYSSERIANVARSWRADRWRLLCFFGQVCIHHLIFSI